MLSVSLRSCSVAACILASAAAAPIDAQEIVFLIRHAERDWSSSDAGLVDAGQARSRAWAGVLADAGLDIVITSEMARTRETGELIASELELPTIAVPRVNYRELLRLISTEYLDDRVLVVGHSSTVPEVIRRLGHPILFHISKSDYNDLFVVETSKETSPKVIRLNIDMPQDS